MVKNAGFMKIYLFIWGEGCYNSLKSIGGGASTTGESAR